MKMQVSWSRPEEENKNVGVCIDEICKPMATKTYIKYPITSRLFLKAQVKNVLWPQVSEVRGSHSSMRLTLKNYLERELPVVNTAVAKVTCQKIQRVADQ